MKTITQKFERHLNTKNKSTEPTEGTEGDKFQQEKKDHHLNMNEQTKMPKNALGATVTATATTIVTRRSSGNNSEDKTIHSLKLFVFTLMNGPKVTKINTKHSTQHAKHLEKTSKHGAKKIF